MVAKMNTGLKLIKASILTLILFSPSAGFAMPKSGEMVTQRDDISDDFYAAGGTIDINAMISGDVVAAGGELFIGHHIKGDVIAAGGSVNLRGDIEDDVRAAGGDVLVDASIGDDLIASGGRINVSSASTVGGEAWLAGGDVNVAGTVSNDLNIGAGSARLSGFVHGDVTIEAGQVHILEGAFIDGNLHYRSPQEANIHPSAKISGKITYEQVEWDKPHRGAGIFFAITMIVASFALYKLFPGFTMTAAGRISDDPLKSLGAGFLVLVIAPLTAALLMAIVLGVWIGLSIMALYLVALIVGFLVSCFFVGDWAARRFKKDVSTNGRRFISVALAIVVIGLLSNIPLLGGLLVLTLLLSGLGAVVMQLKDAYSQTGDV
jgi:cytoskeletal protein CcmA (bactofilin family)